MAIVDCRECGKQVSEEAKLCPHCGIANPYFRAHLLAEVAKERESAPKKAGGSIIKRVFFGGLSVFTVLFVAVKATELIAKRALPICEVVSVTPEADIFLVNGKADAGVKVTTRVKKLARDGIVKVSVRLSTSEGDWTRETSRTMKTNEQRDTILQFPEPTINVQNVEAIAFCNS